MTIAVIDYGSGNLRSVERALIAAGGKDVRVTADPGVIAGADRIVLPGQGAFHDCMAGLKGAPGVLEAMTEAVRGPRALPFLGICVGMQLLADKGLELGEHEGLGWIGGVCRRFAMADPNVRAPQMGWNTAEAIRPHPVFDALAPSAYVYFNHSFVIADAPAETIVGQTTYGERFACALARDNMVGVQFHPEKSQAKGLALLTRFIAWSP